LKASHLARTVTGMEALTARIARRRSAAHIDRSERKHVGHSGRAAYSARRANRAIRQSVRVELAGWSEDQPALEFDPDELDSITGLVPDWMVVA
jgi:hypothetical protein